MLADIVFFLFRMGFFFVLILVLLEYARRHKIDLKGIIEERLNPCFTGICSPTLERIYRTIYILVLILVLLEYARRPPIGAYKT